MYNTRAHKPAAPLAGTAYTPNEKAQVFVILHVQSVTPSSHITIIVLKYHAKHSSFLTVKPRPDTTKTAHAPYVAWDTMALYSGTTTVYAICMCGKQTVPASHFMTSSRRLAVDGPDRSFTTFFWYANELHRVYAEPEPRSQLPISL